MKKTYTGSCHCGAVQFEADLDLQQGTRRCNCSFCFKTHFWKAFAKGDTFRLKKGVGVLTDYRSADSQWPDNHIHHYFCSKCGVRPFSKGFLDQFGGWFHAVNINTLNNASDQELAEAPVQFEDGRNDKQEQPPAETRHL